MDVRLRGFGSIEVEGQAYEHDVVIDRGTVRKRSKSPQSRHPRQVRTHSALGRRGAPGGGPRVDLGTGAHGSLPIMPEVAAGAAHRNVELVVVPDGKKPAG